MDGWMDGWMGGWMDGWMVGWMGGAVTLTQDLEDGKKTFGTKELRCFTKTTGANSGKEIFL